MPWIAGATFLIPTMSTREGYDLHAGMNGEQTFPNTYVSLNDHRPTLIVLVTLKTQNHLTPFVADYHVLLNENSSERPDYWKDGMPVSEIQSRGVGQIRILNAEEIEGMRLAGRVSFFWEQTGGFRSKFTKLTGWVE